MSLSTCQKCGGHMPLGPDATNRCEKCGASVWLEIHGEPVMKQIHKMHARLAEAERLLREARSIVSAAADSYGGYGYGHMEADALQKQIDAFLEGDT